MAPDAMPSGRSQYNSPPSCRPEGKRILPPNILPGRCHLPTSYCRCRSWRNACRYASETETKKAQEQITPRVPCVRRSPVACRNAEPTRRNHAEPPPTSRLRHSTIKTAQWIHRHQHAPDFPRRLIPMLWRWRYRVRCRRERSIKSIPLRRRLRRNEYCIALSQVSANAAFSRRKRKTDA
jgi:hypothetical protein